MMLVDFQNFIVANSQAVGVLLTIVVAFAGVGFVMDWIVGAWRDE